MDIPLRNDTSSMLRSIITTGNSTEMIGLIGRDCFKWTVNNGDKVFFWEDWWHTNGIIQSQFPRLYRISNLKHYTVKEFWIEWNKGENLWLRPLNSRDESDLISFERIVYSISLGQEADFLKWIPSKGIFTTKKCREFLSGYQSGGDFHWRRLWNSKLPPKISMFLWKVKWGILPTKSLLAKRLKLGDSEKRCKWCDFCEESIDHLFWRCNLAKWGWLYVFKWWNMGISTYMTRNFSLDWLMMLQDDGIVSQIWRIVVGGTCWSIWLTRNDNIFNNIKISKETLELLIFTRISKWGLAAKLTPFCR